MRGVVLVPLLAELSFPGIDPVALHIGRLEIRWYGLMYLAGFLVADLVLVRLAKDGLLPLAREKAGDLISWLVVSVILGGRLGYALFYEQSLLIHPLELVKIWEGGLSFHGGLLGVAVGSWLFARRHGVPWLRLGDALALAVPFGIFFVRCANFINGELYGRLAPAWLPWAMRFPTDPVAKALAPELARGGGLDWHPGFVAIRATGEWSAMLARVPLRHPSQLYEATLEGLLTGAILWAAYARKGALTRSPGGLAALFLLLYAASRFLVEFTREPDVQLGYVLGPFSMGQLLSLGMVGGGLWILARLKARGAASIGDSPAL